MSDLSRRDWIKVVGVAGAASAVSGAVNAAESVVPNAALVEPVV
jgi:hypothetical protein